MFLDPKYRAFKTMIQASTIRQAGGQIGKRARGVFLAQLAVESPSWLTKRHTVRKRDLDNVQKLLIDAVCEALGFDDCRLWEVRARKVCSKQPMIRVKIYCLGDVVDLIGATP